MPTLLTLQGVSAARAAYCFHSFPEHSLRRGLRTRVGLPAKVPPPPPTPYTHAWPHPHARAQQGGTFGENDIDYDVVLG